MTRQILYTRQLPGDITIQIGRLGAHGGQQAGSPRPECRVTGPGWDSGWHGMWSESVVRARLWWEWVETDADIPAAWAETVGTWPPETYPEDSE